MLRRVITVPRHYLEHSVAFIACRLSTRNSPSVRIRWSTVAATSPQYSAIRRVSRCEESCTEEDVRSRDISPPKVTTFSKPDSPKPVELLANEFTTFLGYHGQTTEAALRCLSSASPNFSCIHQIIHNPRCVARVARHLAASNIPAFCVRLLSLAVACGLPPKAPTYEAVCWTLSLNKRYAVLLEVYRLAKDNLSAPTRRLLDWRLRAFYELENFAAVEEILQDYEEAGIKPSRRTWHLILIAHLRNRNLAAARQCLVTMERTGFPLDPTTHATIATNYGYLGLDPKVRDLAISALGSLAPPNGVFVVNQLLKSYLRFDDEIGFRQLLSLFDSDSIAPLQSLLNLSGELEDLATSSSFPNSPPFLVPDATTFITVIRFYAARSDFLTAEKIFPLMEKRAISLSPAILVAYLDVQFAIGRPDFAAYVSSQLLLADNLDDLFELLIRRQPKPHWKWLYPTSRIPPHIDIFNALLKGLLPVHGLEAARIILQLMKRVNLEPNSHTLRILIAHLIYSERTSPSTVLRTLRQLSPVFRPSLVHLHSVVSCLLKDEKRRLYSPRPRPVGTHDSLKTQRHGFSPLEKASPDLNGPTAGLDVGAFLARPNLARSPLQSMASRGIRSDSAMLGLRIRYDGIIQRDMIAAVDTYTSMLSRGLSPSHYHVAALMEGFVQQGELDTALKIMRSVKDENMKPNLVMYTILLHGYAHWNRPKAALQLFQDMVSSGIKPDVRAIYALCNAFVLARQLASAKRVLVTLWSYIQPFPQGYDGLPLLELLNIFRNLDPSFVISRRNLRLTRRIWLRQKLAQIVTGYKDASGLQGQLFSGSSATRRLSKASLHVNRKI
ncbi:hypothetical protein P691DRAFT_721441 [Macrolepiota fuliginosa MF-IS2]|uniref:Pentatricopeptide repeat-containing protein n=1 Tax=Macrolepiota fuliginosa MF-IS2 TaxID=1400762 RepID=A0A9P5XKZ4_9AGAR|nr:hypothetical protein P691DRAFT_721441 [Macrolepiota fuliginosa MF-IS2]